PAPQQTLEPDPHLPDDERQAGQAEELDEVAPGDVVVLRPVDGEVVPPGRLRRRVAAVGRGGLLLVAQSAHGTAPSPWTISSIASRETVWPVALSASAAVTSTYAAGAPRGAIRLTFVVIVCPPKRKRLTGRSRGRSRSTSARVP